MSPLIVGEACCALVGIGIAVWGRRGRRIDDHPICRRCRFDLIGISSVARICPECGVCLTSRRPIRIGNRRRNRPIIAAGLIMLLAGVAVGGVLGWKSLSRVEWITIKPCFLLMRDLRSIDPELCSDAQFELADRIAAGRVGMTAMGQLARDFEAESNALKADRMPADSQERLDRDYRLDQWGSVLSRAARKGLLTGDETIHFLQQVVRVEVAAPADAPSGAWIPIVTGPYGWLDRAAVEVDINAWPGSLACERRLESVCSGEMGLEFLDRGAESGFENRDWQRWHDVRVSLQPGLHRLRVTMHYDVYFPGNTGSPGGGFSQAVEFPLTVRPAGAPSVLLVSSPPIPESSSRQIVAQVQRFENRDGERWLNVHFSGGRYPVLVVGRITLRWGDEVFQDVGHIDCESYGTHLFFATGGANVLPRGDVDPGSRLDVTITPDPEYAALHTLHTRIWGQSITIEDVPARWPP